MGLSAIEKILNRIEKKLDKHSKPSGVFMTDGPVTWMPIKQDVLKGFICENIWYDGRSWTSKNDGSEPRKQHIRISVELTGPDIAISDAEVCELVKDYLNK